MQVKLDPVFTGKTLAHLTYWLYPNRRECSYHFAIMNIVSLLSERRVLPDVDAGARDEVLKEMVDHLVATGGLSECSQGAVVEALIAREERISTDIGYGVAIPHCYSDSLHDPVAVFGRSGSGVDFNACDSAAVHFIILLLVPENQPNSHLQTLAGIARLFSQHAVREKMSKAPTSSALLRALEQCQLELD